MILVAPRFARCRRALSRLGPLRLLSSSYPLLASSGSKKREELNFNPEVYFDDAPNPEHVNYKRVTSNSLESFKHPPRRVKMLVRDYIEDSLYNPNYGYFSKRATIVTSPKHIDFNTVRDSAEFQEEVAKRYVSYGRDEPGPGKQLWHTPTEIFKPWYGQSIAKCIVSEYILKYFPYEDFVIYEIGAGNGTLALDILDYIRDAYPQVYERTRYNIVEISGSLAKLQERKLKNHPCVTIANKSIFRWDQREDSPCMFIAMEVIDNFAHDMIRYDLRTLEPYQGLVAVDENGEYSTYFTKVTDPLISSFLQLRKRLFHPPPLPRLFKASATFRNFYSNLPFSRNLSAPEFIPTRLVSLLQTLRRYFPRHRLLLSDFSSLPDAIPGVNAPIVQTRYQNTTVPTSTLFVHPGYFDIFFPTDFERLRDMYEHILAQPDPSVMDSFAPRGLPLSNNASPLSIGPDFFSSHHPRNRRPKIEGVISASGLPVGERESSVFTHAEFLQTYADLSRTRLKNGENPMLQYYKNVKFLF